MVSIVVVPNNRQSFAPPAVIGPTMGNEKNVHTQKVHVAIVNGTDRKENLLHVQELNGKMATDVITISPSNNQQHIICHKVQRVYLKDDDDDDKTTRALENSYHHMERAINYLQQEIHDKNTLHLRQPPINRSRTHIWNARQHYFDLDTQQPQPQPDVNHIFDDFRKRPKEGRERAARSVLDLHAIDRSVRHEIDRMTSSNAASSSPTRQRRSPPARHSIGPISQASKRRSRSAGYLETDIDSLLSRQVEFETCIDDENSNWIEPISTPVYSAKALSMLSLRRPHDERGNDDAERARSMEFLLDAENKVAAQPPENQLMHGEGKTLSEHELRIRRSLQRLDVPEWFKNSPYSQAGSFLLKKKEDEDSERWQGLSSRTPSASSVASYRYTAISNTAGVSGTSTPSSTSAMTRIVPPYCWRYPSRWSKESLQSPVSPSPMQDRGQVFARWGSISTSPSPTGSLHRPAQALLTRQPYLGWRSSERLTREVSSAESTPTHNSSNFYRSAAERLSAGPGYYALRYGGYASKPRSEGSLLSARRAVSAGPSPTEPPISMHKKASSKPPIPPKPQLSPTSGLYRSTVTQQNGNDEDAIHDYSSEKEEESSPKSPRHRNIWMESSFVGVKPVFNNGKLIQDERKEMDFSQDLSRGTTPSPIRSGGTSDEEEIKLNTAKRSFGQLRYEEENESKDSGSSLAGLEEVLDSLLAIPTSSHSVSPSSRSHLYLGDDSDTDAQGNIQQEPIKTDGVNCKPSKIYHGTISDHLLATTIGQSSTDDDTSFSLLDKEHYQSQRSLGLATPSPKQQSFKATDNEIQELHVHWGPDEKCSSLKRNLALDTNNDFADSDKHPTNNDENVAKESASDTEVKDSKANAVKLRRGSEQLRNLLPDDLLVRCSYPNCAKTVEWVEARRSFKTCHNCYTYYCNRECRRVHWDKHRRTCMYSRIRSLCKHVILRSRDDPAVQAHLTKLARTGLMSQGRGFIKLAFRNPELVERFLQQGWQALEDNPIYVAWRDLLPQELGPEISHEVTELCKQYNPETKFVLLAAVYLTREIPEQPVPRWEREVIAKCSKVTLRKFGSDDYNDSLFEPDTLILTAVPLPSDVSPEKARERCFHNILRHLRQRGVSLRHQFPDVFQMLTAYVEQSEIFPPITIYPKDGRTGKTFMCLIMPNTEPEIEELINDFSRK